MTYRFATLALGVSFAALTALVVVGCSSDDGNTTGGDSSPDAAAEANGSDANTTPDTGGDDSSSKADSTTGEDSSPGQDGSASDSGEDGGSADSGTDGAPADSGGDAGSITKVHDWNIETVDANGDVGAYASLQLDPTSQHPMISYYDNLHAHLKFASNDGSSWNIVDVVSQNSGEYSQMAVDSKGTPYIVYRDQNLKGLFLATRSGQTWNTEQIEMGMYMGWDASLALEEQGGETTVHVAYHDFDKGDLRYAVRALDGTWTSELVDGANEDVGWYTSIKVDGSGTIFISYVANEDSSLRFAYKAKSDTSWSTEVIDASTTIGDTQYLALDPQGRPCVAYNHDAGLQSAKPTLYYAIKDNGAWKTERVDKYDNDNGQYPSIAFDSSGSAHISYLAGGTLRHAWKDGTAWKAEVVDDDGVVGAFTSMVIDGNDKVHVAYRDVNKTSLKYAVEK